MFSIFKKKDPIVILREQHRKLLEKSFIMSKINRLKADEYYSEAMVIEKKIKELNETK
jgi:hypothetical protein